MAQQPATAATAPKSEHRHADPKAEYQHTCPVCREEDRKRSALNFRAIPEDDLVRTTFLVPDSDFDNSVCRAYINHKYPYAQYVSSQIDIKRVVHYPDGEQIVIVRRDTWPKPPAAAQKKVKDAEDRWVYEPIPPESLVHEVVESEALNVRDLIVTKKADRFTKATQDNVPLLRRISELMPPPYRIDLPRDPADVLMTFVHA